MEARVINKTRLTSLSFARSSANFPGDRRACDRALLWNPILVQEAPCTSAKAGELWNTIRTVLILGAAARELGGSQLYRSNETVRL